MKVAVWHNQKGPAAVFTLPEDKKIKPASAMVPGAGARSYRDMNAKGPKVSWEDWAQHLTEQHPYFGWWTVQTIPDNLPGTRDMLDYVRHEALHRNLVA